MKDVRKYNVVMVVNEKDAVEAKAGAVSGKTEKVVCR